jgi:hypothetical protein
MDFIHWGEMANQRMLRKRFCFSLRTKPRGSLEPYYLSTEASQPDASRGRRFGAVAAWPISALYESTTNGLD